MRGVFVRACPLIVAGDTLSHQSQLYLNDLAYVTTSIQANDQVRIVEPQLNVDSRIFSTAQVDGGDILDVTVTLSATSGVDFTDALELISRALRAGHSLASGISLVSEEMRAYIERLRIERGLVD